MTELVTKARFIGAGAALLVAVALAGCASASSVSVGGPSAASARGVTSAPAVDFVVDAHPASMSWPDASSSLVPLPASRGSFVSAKTAYAVVSEGIKNVSAGESAGPTVAGLYAYSNAAHGEIQTDGSVKLSYADVPVWDFSVPLVRYVDDSQGGIGRAPSSPVVRSNCFAYFVVKASDGEFLTSSEECTTRDPNSPAPSPAR